MRKIWINLSIAGLVTASWLLLALALHFGLPIVRDFLDPHKNPCPTEKPCVIPSRSTQGYAF